MEGHKTQAGKPEEQIFYDAFRASPIGIAVEDLEGRPLFVNPAFCSFLGFSEEELRTKHCVEFSPPEDAQKDWALFQQLRAGVIDHYQLEKRYFRRDGSLVWGRLSISLLKSRPSPLVLAMVEDITEKKRAEEARFRHSAIVESSEDAIISKNLDAVIVSWNAGAQRIFGYTEAEAVGRPITILIPPELQDEAKKILEKLRAGERIEHYETMRVKKTGIKINVSLTISPIRDSTGRIVGFSKIARDISERKLAEEALRASEERLRLAQQAARIGTFEWNIQTGVNTWTPELEEMYGLPMGGFGGTQTAFENLVHPDDRTGVIKLVDAAMKSGQPTKGEWRVVWADGSVHWIAGCWQVFMDASGEPSKMIGVNIDVTERKRAEGALRESEERYRLAAQAGRMYAFDWDVATDVIVRSEGSSRIFGLPGEPTKLTKRGLLTCVHPEDRATFCNSIAECTPERPNTQISYRLLRPDGSVLWLERTGHAFFDEQRRMVRMIGIVADVTERRRADEVLRRSQGYLAEAERLAHSGSWAWDTRTRDAFWSPEMFRILGYDPEKTRPSLSNVWARVHPEDRLRMERVLKEATTGLDQDVTSDYRIVLPDGTIKHIHAIAHPVTNDSGEVVEVVGTSMDVTERRRAEKALRESEERFRLVANTAPVMICMSDIDKLCTYFNQGWLDFTGRYLEEEMGDGWAERIHPEDLEECLKTYTNAFDSRERFQMEYRLRRHDGEYRWILDSGVPRFNEDGSFVGYIGSGIDVTERKLAEDALSTLSQKLIEAQEGERTRIARELHDDVGQRLVLLAWQLGSSNGDLRKQVEDLANDVQALSHELHSPKLDYLGLAAAAAGFCKELSDRQRVEIEFHSENISKELPKEISLCLFRVLQEALQNAIKHSGSRQFQISLTGGANEIELTVHDSGVGFEPEEAIKGRGLGLTSMKERLRAVDGELSIDSQLQRGTTIHARVPLSREGHSFGAAG